MTVSETKSVKYPGIWRSFFSMLGKSHLPYFWMALALVFGLLSSTLSLRFPDYVNELLNGVTRDTLTRLFWLGTGAIVLTMLATGVKLYCQAVIDRNMQNMAVEKVLRLTVPEVEKSDSREFVSRITTDTKKMSDLLLQIVIDELPRLYYMIAAVIKIFREYDTTLGLLMLLSVPLALIISFISGKLSFGRADVAQAKISALTARLAEKITGYQTIKSYNTQARETEAGEALIKELETARINYSRIERFNYSFRELATLIPTVLIFVVGATMVLGSRITSGQFAAFYIMAGQFIGYVIAHINLWVAIKFAQGSTYRLSQIMELEDEAAEEQGEQPDGDIVFNGVSFSYGDNKILDSVSFSIEKGRKTAFVGYSGSGKSTILNLLEQFYRPESGTITMGGRDIRDYDVHSFRSAFTYVPQNAPGFSGTIRELMTYGLKEEISDARLLDVLDRCGARDFVEVLGGLDYEVGLNATKLSGGQKQKLCLARAMLTDKEYMLLDEATSALDIEATEKLQSLLDEKMAGKTMVLVAHNLKTILNADKIIVFDSGKIAGEGTYDELLSTCGLFRQLTGKMAEV